MQISSRKNCSNQMKYTICCGKEGGDAMRALFEATQRLDWTAISSIVPLIGLGAGLTPAVTIFWSATWRGFGARFGEEVNVWSLSPTWERG